MQGRQDRGVGEATEILSEMQNMVPGFSQTAAIPDGEGNGEGPATGYSGNDWNQMKTRYIEAMKHVKDPRVLDGMMEQMANLEKGKVMEYGRMALSAMDNGDMETAQNYLAGVSFFTDPGVTPTVSVQPDGTTLMAVEGQKPVILTKPQLEDFLHQYSNFEGYRDLAFDKEKHRDMMEHREKVRMDNALDAQARRGLAERELNAKETLWDQQSAYDQARVAKLEQEMEHADLNMRAGASQAKLERVDKIIEDAQTYVQDYLKDPGSVSGTEKGTKDDGALIGMGPEAIPPEDMTDEERAKWERVQAAKDSAEVSDADTLANTAIQRARQATMQRILSDPATAMDFNNLVTALAGGSVYTDGDTAATNLSGAQAASVALSVIASEGAGYDPQYDAQNGQIVIVRPPGPNGQASAPDRYKVDPAYSGLLGTMLTPYEDPNQQPEQQGPPVPPAGQPQGIPEQQGP